MSRINTALLLVAGALLTLPAGTAFAYNGAQGHGAVGLTLTPILETTVTIAEQPIRFPQGETQLVAVVAEVEPGGQVGRHLHPVPLFV